MLNIRHTLIEFAKIDVPNTFHQDENVLTFASI